MKICNYIHNHSLTNSGRLGILLEENEVLDPNLCYAFQSLKDGHYNPYERANDKLPSSLYDLLNLKENPLDILQKAYDLFLNFKKKGDLSFPDGKKFIFPLGIGGEAKLTKPLDKISTYRDFYAHEKHVRAGFEKRKEPVPEAWYEIPAYYKGATQGFIGPHETILWPKYSNKLDYELELAAVISCSGINIKENQALKHIFGLTILNDISARDIQKKEMSIRLGPAKGKDFCSVIGPVITTMDEFNHSEPSLEMTASINGVQWSKGSSGDSRYNFQEMIAHASQDEWILPADLFGSGTVGTGCGLELDKWIQEGDQIDLSIEQIGTLTNIVGKKQI